MNSLNIQRYGTGHKKLVAIHGLGSASSAWKLLKSALHADYELITLDLPGHGDAKIVANKKMTPNILADIVTENLKLNGIEEFHLIGNSLGGWVALEMAAKYPESVRSLTALAPAGLWLKLKNRRIFTLDFSRVLARIFHRFARILLRFKIIKKISFGLVSPRWESFSLETCVDAAIAMGTSRGYKALWFGTFGVRFDKTILKRIPVTIVFGDSDWTLPAINCQEQSLAPDHCDWVVLPKTGHAPMWDSLESVLPLLYKTTN